MEVVKVNAIVNHDFSKGLLSWHPNSCNGFVSDGSDYAEEIKAESGSQFAVVSNRTQCWQGLEQDITPRLLPHVTYHVLALVRIWGSTQQTTDLLATLRLENPNSAPTFLRVGRATASRERWEKLEGTFSLQSLPCRVIFYLEGPLPGIDLLIDRIHIWSATIVKDELDNRIKSGAVGNIIANPNFNMGLNGWFANSCIASTYSFSAESSKMELGLHALISNRRDSWQGLEQDITTRLMPNVQYKILASVRVEGSPESIHSVMATLRLENNNTSPNFLSLARVIASVGKWEQLEGTFYLEVIPGRAVFYLEGPPAGFNFSIASVEIYPVSKSISNVSAEQNWMVSDRCLKDEFDNRATSGAVGNIIVNPIFNMGLNGWVANSCIASTYSFSAKDSKIALGLHALISSRTDSWQGLEQDIATRLMPNVQYRVLASLRVEGSPQSIHFVKATLRLENKNASPNFLSLASVKALVGKWEQLEGTFSLEVIPERAVFYLEGPPAGFKFSIKCVEIYPVSKSISSVYTAQKWTVSDSCLKGELNWSFADGHDDHNIIQNPMFEDGVNHWTGRSCNIVLHDVAKGEVHPSGGQHFASATDRTQGWHGIQQDITEHLKRKTAYEVKVMVRISSNFASAEVLASLWIQTSDLRERYITMGRVQASSKEWTQLQGKFLLNPEPTKAIAYLEGPPAGIDILVGSFSMRPVTKPSLSPAPAIEVSPFFSRSEKDALYRGRESERDIGLSQRELPVHPLSIVQTKIETAINVSVHSSLHTCAEL